MPFNLLKNYPELLELGSLDFTEKEKSLKRVFNRDINNDAGLFFHSKKIRPTKGDGDPMDILFIHLTTESVKTIQEGKEVKKRFFDEDRSKRMHWIKYHIDENKKKNMEIFSIEERRNGNNIIRTYLYDVDQQYIIVLEPQNSGKDYYLITAYFLNRKEGIEGIKKKLKKKLLEVY